MPVYSRALQGNMPKLQTCFWPQLKFNMYHCHSTKGKTSLKIKKSMSKRAKRVSKHIPV
jgi:hypothetical protein